MENVKDFFLKDNKSGFKTTENWLSKNHNELYTAIIENSNDKTIPFKEKVYLYINDLKDVPKCPNCGNNVKFVDTLNKGHSKYCSINCLNSSEEHKEKIKDSNMNKYGVESHNQLDSVKEKKKQTTLKNYGVESPLQSKEIREKFNNTLFNNYGVDSPMKIQSVIDNRKQLVLSGDEFNLKRMLNRINDDTLKFIKRDNGVVHFYCNICKSEFVIDSNLITSRLYRGNKICLNCNKRKSFSSIVEIIINKLKENNIEYELNNRKLLSGLELDINLPKYKLAIEINGMYWHCELYKNNDYHLNKTLLCEKREIKLLHFFEDEILFKTDVVVSNILCRLNIFNNIIDINKCELKEINEIEVDNFLYINHLSGVIESDIRIGLFYNNDLVSVMCFKNNLNNEYEILRFTNKLNTKINGCASKFLSYFKNTYKPKLITISIDRKLNNDSIKQLGFKFIKNTEPNYLYIKPGDLNRHYFSDHNENSDPSKTEHEIMLEKGYYRIYDCGNTIYELKL